MSTPLNVRQWGSQSSVGKEVEVAPDQITFSQHQIDPAKVERIAQAMKAGQTMAPAIGSLRNGVFKTEDGHHRIAAAMRLGKKSLRVKVF